MRIHYATAFAAPAMLFTALSLATPAMAQETGATAPRVGAEDDQVIIVTAQRRSEVLAEVPLSVQAFTGETLETTGVRDLGQLIAFVPGASEGRGNAAGIKSYQIRGVSSFYGDSTIGYYIDEAAYVIPNRNYAPVARSFDVERVEVLRGPQGTLYGLGSMGGTVRFITADPDLDDFTVRGAVGYSFTEGGEDNNYQDLAVSAPIIEDKLAVRAVASHEHLGGYATSPSFPGDYNDDTIQNYRFKVLAEPTDAITVKFSYNRNETEDDWGRNLAATSPPRYPASPVAGRNRQVFDVYSGYVSLDLGPVVLESSTGYIDRTDKASGPIVLGPGPAARLDVLGDSESFVQEVRAVSNHGGPWEWVLGGIYQDSNSLEDIKVIGGPPISAYSIYDSKSWAAFGELSVGLFDDKLRPLVGLRYFQDDRDFISQNRPPGPTLPPAFEASETFESLNPRFNLSYQPRENATLYVNVAKGFRSGTFNTAAAVAASGGAVGFAVDPDELWSYEAGAKVSSADNRMFVEVALYQIDWSDVQLNYTVAGGVQIIRNAGEVEGNGVDLLFNWRATDYLTLQGTANVNSTEFTNIVNPAAFAATPNIAVGKQVASVPERTYSLGATYNRPIGGDYHLYANASYTYLSEQGDTGDNLGRLGEDHELVRGRVGVERGGIGFYIFGDNILDDDGPIQVSGSGSTRYYPRVIGAEIKFDY